MPLPSVNIVKNSGGSAGAVRLSSDGVNAIIAASSTGQANLPAGYSTQQQASTDFGPGPLAEYAAYDMAISQKPTVLVKATASTAGAYANFASSIGGTAVVTPAGTPFDEYAFVKVSIVAPGTIGVAGITYTYSLDGGQTTSGVQALGTATTLAIPNTGVSFTLVGAQTFFAGDNWSVYTTRPQMSNADLVSALEALRTTQNLWENVLIDVDATTTTINTVDTWLAGLEAKGQFHGAFLNTRHKTVPVPTAESEATFAAAMGVQFAQAASIRLSLGTDAGDTPSQITGIVQPRPVSLALAARCALIPLGEDPAFVNRGNVPGFGIADGKGNPKWHDENLYPGLDDQRLTTFRTVPTTQGVYITDGLILSPSGSAFVFVQHMRCMNKACTVAFQMLVQQLGRGVGKKAPDPITGAIYILESDASAIENLVTNEIKKQLGTNVVDAAFKLHRNDDLSSNTGAILHGDVEIEALAYIKGFQVTASFVKAITVSL